LDFSRPIDISADALASSLLPSVLSSAMDLQRTNTSNPAASATTIEAKDHSNPQTRQGSIADIPLTDVPLFSDPSQRRSSTASTAGDDIPNPMPIASPDKLENLYNSPNPIDDNNDSVDGDGDNNDDDDVGAPSLDDVVWEEALGAPSLTYYVGRETILPSPGSSFVRRFGLGLYNFLVKNSRDLSSYLHIPDSELVEVGIRISL